jgi:autotransporter-associated beta strand protein
LTVTGKINGFANQTLTKVDPGQLILPGNYNFSGATDIKAGWITVGNASTLGQVTVENGASLMLKPLYADGSLNPGGSFTLTQTLYLSGVGITDPFAGINQEGALVSLDGNTNVTGAVYLNGLAGIGVQNLDPASFASGSLTLPGEIQDGNTSGGIIKLGTELLTILDNNTFTNNVEVRQGVLLAKNNNALGAQTSESQVIVDTGAALELGGIDPTYDGGQTDSAGNELGLQTWDKNLVLSGSGDPRLGAYAPIVVLVGDNAWRGNVSLDTATDVELPTGTTLSIFGTIDDAANPAPGGSDLTVVGGGELQLYGANTFRGTTYVGTATIAANGGNVDGLIPEIQTLTITGTSGTVSLGYGSAAISVPYNATALAVENALNSLTSLISAGTSVSVTGTGGVYTITFEGGLGVFPQTLLTVSGSGGATASIVSTIPTDFSTNGILTLANSQALGQTVTPEVETVTTSGTTGSFVLSFNGSSTTATLLTDNATALAVQQALDALPTIGQVGGSVSVAVTNPTPETTLYTITFAGSLAGFNESQIQAVGSGGLTATAATTVVGSGGVVVANGATVQLEGSITIAGKPLIVQGTGDGTVPNTVPVQWFNLGSSPVSNGSSTVSTPTSGQVTGIAVNPNNSNDIYISTAGGGAWRTEDDGDTWMPFELPADTTVNGTTDLAVTFSGAIAIDPLSPNIIYLGTGDANNTSDSYYGTGLYESTDGGLTWSLVTNADNSNPLYGTAISSIVVDNHGFVYVAASDQSVNGSGTNAGVWRFNGNTWYNLTAVVSYNRVNTESFLNLPPDVPGPDDDYRLSFPQTDATWSGLAYVDGILYASLGTVSGNNDNGVYRCTNPATARGASGTGHAPVWYVGDGGLDDESATEYPTALIQTVTVTPAGYFDLSFGGYTVGDFPYNDTASDVQAGLDSLPSISGVENGNVLVTSAAGSGGSTVYTVYFEGNATGTLTGQGIFGSVVTIATVRYQNQNVQFSATRLQTLVVASDIALDYGTMASGFIDAGESTSAVQTTVNAISPLTNEGGTYLVTGGFYSAVAGGWVYYINYQPWALSLPKDLTEDPASDFSSYIDSSDIVLFAATSYNGGALYEVRQSTDGGADWFNFQTVNGVSKDVDLITPSVNYLGTSGNYSSSIVALDFTTVYLGGQNTILETTNEGTSWTNITNEGGTPGTDPHTMFLDNSDNLIVGGTYGIWGLYNNTWKNMNGNLSITQFNSVSVSPSDLTYAIGSTDENGIVSFTGSPSWTYIAGTAGSTVQIDPDNVEDVYVLYAGNLYESTTGVSGTFNELTIDPTIFPAITVENFEVDPLNPEHIILIGSSTGFFFSHGDVYQVVYESFNGGQTWIQQNYLRIDAGAPSTTTPLTGLVAQAGEQGTYLADPTSFPDVGPVPSSTYVPGTFYVVDTNQQVNLTKDDGITWVNRTPTLPSGSTIQDIIVDPTDEDTVYLVVDTSTTGSVVAGSVYESTDAGLHWKNITGSGLPSLPFWTIVLDPRTDTLYLGTDNGVWQTVVGSGNWTQVGAGITNEQVKDLQLNQSFNTLTAATGGRGVFVYYIPDFQMTPNSGALRSLSGAATWTGSIILAGATTISAGGAQALENGSSTAQLDILGSISDGSPDAEYQLSKTGLGNVILSGADTYTGLTEIQEGILVVRNPQALGLNSLGGVVEAGTALDVESNLDDVALYLYGDGIMVDGHNTGALENITNTIDTVTGPVHLMTSSVTIGADSNTTLILSGIVDDDAKGIGGNPNAVGGTTLTKELTGEVILTGANTYTGGTNVYQGVLNIQNNNALGAGNGATTNVTDGAQLQLQGGITVTDEGLTLSGTGIAGTGALMNVSGNNTWDGVITMQLTPAFAPASSPGRTIDINVVNATDTLTIGGPSGKATLTEASASFNLDKLGLGTLVLQNNDSYTGTTTVTAGILNVQSANSLGAAGVTVDTGAELDLQTTSAVIFAAEPLTLSGTGTSGVGALNNLSGTNTWSGTVTLSGNSAINVDPGTTTTPSQLTIAGAVGQSVPTGTTAGLTKNGGGLLDLTQPNTYTGTSTINAGTLEVDGSVAAVSLVGGTLAGTGTVGAVTSDPTKGGTVFPGNQETGTPGQLTSGAETWNSNTTYEVDLASTTSFNSLSATGNINLGNANLAGLAATTIPTWSEFTIIQTTGTITGQFAQGNILYLGIQKYYVSYGTSSIVLISMSKYSTSLTISSSANPVDYGQAITLTVSATVTGYTTAPPANLSVTLPPLPTQVPNGSLVTLTFNGTTVSPALILENDTATYSVPVPLNAGTYAVTAYLDETGDWDQSPTATLSGGQVVQAAPTTVSLISSNNPDAYTDSFNITVNVTAQSPGVGTPTGKVDLVVTPVGSSTASYILAYEQLTSGTYTFDDITTGPGEDILIPGMYVITANYENTDGNFANNSGTLTGNQAVTSYTTQATITASPISPSYSDQPVTFTITLANLSNASIIPTGSVTLTVTNANTSPATTYSNTSPVQLDANGQATLTVPGSFLTLPFGVASQNYTVTATYDLDAKFSAPTGVDNPTYTQTVEEIPTQVTLTSSADPVIYASAFTITVNVTSPAGTPTPSGNVTLLFTPAGGGTTLSLPAQAIDTTGTAVFNVNATLATQIALGAYTVTSVYTDPTGVFATSTGTLSNLTVTGTVGGSLPVIQYTTEATISSSSNPSYSGDSVTFTVNMTNLTNSAVPPTGSVTLKAAYSATSYQTLTETLDANGAANFAFTLKLPTTSLPTGKFTITATYALDSSFTAPTGADNPSLTQTVDSAASKPTKVVIGTVPKTVILKTGLPKILVTVETSTGAAATTYTGPVTLAIKTGPTGGTLTGTTTVNAIKGVATFTGLGLPTAGTYTLIATTPTLTSAATAGIIVYTPGVATYITATVISLNQGSFGLQVVARDAVGNVATTYTGTATVALVSSTTGGTLSGTLTVSFVKGVATISGLKVSKTGTYTFDITSGLFSLTLSQYFFLRVL